MPDWAERTNNMSKYLPKELITRFSELSDDFEAVIRADERQRIKKLIDDELVKTVSQPIAMGVATGLHGEPLTSQPVKKTSNKYFMNKNAVKVLGYLERGFVAVPTIAGNLNLKKQTVYAYIHIIKKNGYNIQTRNTGTRRNGYHRIYRVAA